MYGALEDLRHNENMEAERLAYRRHRVNCVPALQCLFFPWLVYMLLSSIGTGVFHYQHPMAYVVFTLLALIAALGLLGFAYRVFKSGSDWFYTVYLAAAILIAVLAAWVVGDSTFWRYMFPAYSIQHSATYTNVDPSTTVMRSGEAVATQGSRYMDAGTVYFNHNTSVDTSRAVSFKLGDLYCAAPIVSGSNSLGNLTSTCTNATCGNDFWAVGINCCSETDSRDFSCGDVGKLHAKSGVREMAEADRGVYRLAVLQAEGIQNIISPHPLFFHWVVDPIAAVEWWKDRGHQRYLLGMYAFFFINAICLAFFLKWRLAVLARLSLKSYDKDVLM